MNQAEGMSPPLPAPSHLELWGGIECSRVRIREEVRDQIHRSGYTSRPDALDRFAELGLKRLRYPILWERHGSPEAAYAWLLADERLARMRALGIEPIVGFVHHGSGPLPGGLMDPAFATGLARFARRVAERYPWIEAYTPVNEPATTARFSGLYGLWYPHGCDARTWARCLMNQCLATRAAMAAIRLVNRTARLIQTEDVGKVHSTPRLAYQAEFENERRWLTFDLLTGRLGPSHALWSYLVEAGIHPQELESFQAEPCAPDILGMNHYVTSERFLDDAWQRYPVGLRGGNGRDAYVDVPAVRIRAEGAAGPAQLLRELWDRYHLPIAVTEVQLACTRDEQLRWLHEVWEAARAVRHEGADVRAVTSWALLGSFDWDSLLCEDRGNYESGAFDIRGGTLRPTAVAAALRSLAGTGRIEHPVAAAPGWWRRETRLLYPPVSAPRSGAGTALSASHVAAHIRRSPPILIVGANGLLGAAFARLCSFRGLHAVALSRRELDIAEASAVRDAIRRVAPWGVINCAGYRRIDGAESHRELCTRENVTGVRNLAVACADHGTRLVSFSSDLVFDGTAMAPYVESDLPAPLNHYGRSKVAAETLLREVSPEALIIRTGAVFGPWDERNFLTTLLKRLAAGHVVGAASEFVVSPAYVPDLVNAVLDLMIDGAMGVWHLANQGALTWCDWARRTAEVANFERSCIREATAHELGWSAPRPPFAALVSERSQLMPPWEDALERYVETEPWLPTSAAA